LATSLKYEDSDPFFRARWKLTALYYIIGALIFIISGTLVDIWINNSINNIIKNERRVTVQEAIRRTSFQRWEGRFVTLTLIATAGYFLARLAMTPLKKASKRQSLFIANVSHELRTPIAVMKTSLEVALRQQKQLDNENKNLIKSSIEELDRMSSIIKFLLAFSDFENKKVALTMHVVNFTDIIKRSVNLLESSAENSQISLICDAEKSISIIGNETALEEMLVNLVGNSINHSRQNGYVKISLKEDEKNKKVILNIEDDGAGIDKKDIPHLFDPFYRSENSDNISKGGLGLGLSIVYGIVELHKGKINVESEIDKGSTFTIQFPSHK